MFCYLVVLLLVVLIQVLLQVVAPRLFVRVKFKEIFKIKGGVFIYNFKT